MNHDSPSGNCVRKYGCTKPECKARRTAYQTSRQKLYRAKQSQLFPAKPAAKRLKHLVAQNYTVTQLAAEFGMTTSGLHLIMNGITQQVTRTTLEKIMREPTGVPKGPVPILATARRLQGLTRIGYNRNHLQSALAELGVKVTTSWISVTMALGTETVAGDRAHAVHQLFDRIGHVPGPSHYAMTWGQRQGYAAPAAWDESTIEDPEAKPEGTLLAIPCLGCGRGTVSAGHYRRLNQRQRWRMRPHHGNGLCDSCHSTKMSRQSRASRSAPEPAGPVAGGDGQSEVEEAC